MRLEAGQRNGQLCPRALQRGLPFGQRRLLGVEPLDLGLQIRRQRVPRGQPGVEVVSNREEPFGFRFLCGERGAQRVRFGPPDGRLFPHPTPLILGLPAGSLNGHEPTFCLLQLSFAPLQR